MESQTILLGFIHPTRHQAASTHLFALFLAVGQPASEGLDFCEE